MAARPFIYFDLGNVLLHFDHGQACRQLGSVMDLPAERVREFIFASPLQGEYERGLISTAEFCRRLRAIARRPVADAELQQAASDIFTVNAAAFRLVGGLCDAGYRLGVLSNTCDAHWQYIRRFLGATLDERFAVFALSFELGVAKPHADIYVRAARLAAAEPSQILFIDDLPANVAGARACGFDALHYQGDAELHAALRQRQLI